MTVLYFHADVERDFGKVTKESDQFGEVSITITEARDLWRAGKVTDCNLAFNRLARNDFDIKATLQEYRDME